MRRVLARVVVDAAIVAATLFAAAGTLAWPRAWLLLGVLLAARVTTAVAARDAFRWRLLPAPPRPVAAVGLALFAAGWALVALSLRANAFAVATVRLQRERAHAVADTGVYAVVRHPMYAASPLVNVGLALWLGSPAAALVAVVPLGLLVACIALEARVLRRELPGYGAYAARVPYRLLPGVW